MSYSNPSTPTTPVRVPKSASRYTPQTLDPSLRSQINAVLLSGGHIEKISTTLHHALSSSPTNLPTRIATHALSLLRSGECVTFPALMERVVHDVKRDTEAEIARLASAAASGNGTGPSSLDKGPKDGLGTAKAEAGAVNGVKPAGNRTEEFRTPEVNPLAIPKVVRDEGLRITRECLELVCEMES